MAYLQERDVVRASILLQDVGVEQIRGRSSKFSVKAELSHCTIDGKRLAEVSPRCRLALVDRCVGSPDLVRVLISWLRDL